MADKWDQWTAELWAESLVVLTVDQKVEELVEKKAESKAA